MDSPSQWWTALMIFCGGQDGCDRVLLQVPCSADAQFRKNGAGSSACRDWEPRTGMRLHKRQLASLSHSLELLQAGGVVVYSSRSFNPLECEAVVGAALALCGGSVVLEAVDWEGGFRVVSTPPTIHCVCLCLCLCGCACLYLCLFSCLCAYDAHVFPGAGERRRR